MIFVDELIVDVDFAGLFADFRHGGYRVLGDIICDLDDALELGALTQGEVVLSDEEIQAVAALTPKDIPAEVIHTLIAYYHANKPEDADLVVLPVASFDAYFGSTNFSHKWLAKIPNTILTREKQSFGVCRYKENI